MCRCCLVHGRFAVLSYMEALRRLLIFGKHSRVKLRGFQAFLCLISPCCVVLVCGRLGRLNKELVWTVPFCLPCACTASYSLCENRLVICPSFFHRRVVYDSLVPLWLVVCCARQTRAKLSCTVAFVSPHHGLLRLVHLTVWAGTRGSISCWTMFCSCEDAILRFFLVWSLRSRNGADEGLRNVISSAVVNGLLQCLYFLLFLSSLITYAGSTRSASCSVSERKR